MNGSKELEKEAENNKALFSRVATTCLVAIYFKFTIEPNINLSFVSVVHFRALLMQRFVPH